jgi:hypothetical protein
VELRYLHAVTASRLHYHIPLSHTILQNNVLTSLEEISKLSPPLLSDKNLSDVQGSSKPNTSAQGLYFTARKHLPQE